MIYLILFFIKLYIRCHQLFLYRNFYNKNNSIIYILHIKIHTYIIYKIIDDTNDKPLKILALDSQPFFYQMSSVDTLMTLY